MKIFLFLLMFYNFFYFSSYQHSIFNTRTNCLQALPPVHIYDAMTYINFENSLKKKLVNVLMLSLRAFKEIHTSVPF